MVSKEIKKEIEGLRDDPKSLAEAFERLNEALKKTDATLRKLEEGKMTIGKEEVFRKEITKWGNSAHIPMPSRYIGRKVLVRMIKEPGFGKEETINKSKEGGK